MRFGSYSITEDLDEKSLYLSILKAIDADMTPSYSTTNGNNKSILAVDDENAIVDIIKQSLQRQEFKVCTFTDPFKALTHFNSASKEDYHHIVLSDIRMPGMNGYEFKKDKRKRSESQSNPYERFRDQ
jgi:PleD family two-component response regulator